MIHDANAMQKDHGDCLVGVMGEGFELTKVLNEDSRRKMMCVQGKFGDRGDALVVLEKTPFSADVAKDMLTGDTDARIDIVNDVYHSQMLFPSKTNNGKMKLHE